MKNQAAWHYAVVIRGERGVSQDARTQTGCGTTAAESGWDRALASAVSGAHTVLDLHLGREGYELLLTGSLSKRCQNVLLPVVIDLVH